MKRLPWLLVVLLAGCNASPDGLNWLRAAARAERGLARSGLQHVESWPEGRHVAADVAVQCDGRGAQRREHRTGPCAGLVVLDSAGCEYRRAATGQPWTQRPRLGHAEVDLADDDLAQIRANYRLSLRPAPEVLGRAAVRLDLRPRRGGPWRRLWLDRATGLVLVSDAFDQRGRLSSRVTFTQLALGPVADDLSPPRVALPEDRLPLAQLAPVADGDALAGWTGERLAVPAIWPAGFRLHGYLVRTARSGRLRPVLTLSDGLALVTVFDRGPGRPGQSRCVLAGDGAQTVVTRTTSRREWVLIGEQSGRVLAALARALPD